MIKLRNYLKNKKFYFREHRGSLVESLKTEISFISFKDFINYLNYKYSEKISIKFYGVDNRFNIGSTYIVSCSLGVLGFLYLKDSKSF